MFSLQFFARVLHSEYVRRKELKIQLVKSMRAVEVLHRYFRPAFAAYLKRKVDRVCRTLCIQYCRPTDGTCCMSLSLLIHAF